MANKILNKLIIFLLIGLAANLQAQKVGINTSFPQTSLDVNGSVAFREGAPLSITGLLTNDLALSASSFYRITDAIGAFSLSGFAGGQDGQIVIFVNGTGFNMTINHQSILSLPINRVITGNASDLTLAPNGIVTLMYSNSSQRWIVSSFSGAIGNANNGWGLTGNANTAAGTNFIGTTDAQDVVVKANNTEGVRLTTAGNFGIGTPTPINKLSVAGNANINNHLAVGANSAIDNGALLQGGSTFKNVISAQEEVTGNQTTTYTEGILSHLSINATNNPTTEFYAMDGIAEVKLGNVQNYAAVIGNYNGANHRGTGTVSKLYGASYYAQNKAAGTVTDLRGLHIYPANNSSGTVTSAYGIFTKGINNIGTGTVANAYGLYVDGSCNTGGGILTNNYGVFIEDQSSAGTTHFNFYSKGSTTKNYFAGLVGIGTTDPQYKLDINANITGTGNPLRLQGLQAGASGDSVLTSLSGVVRRRSVSELLSSSAWSTTGNTATVDGTNFIGTTDNIPLSIKVNNQKSGRIDHLLHNAFWGYYSGNDISSGTNNVAMGSYTLLVNSTGNYNTGIGANSLTSNIGGSYNTGVGYYALHANIAGYNNAALGTNALGANTSGYYNAAAGSLALSSNTSGYSNTALGYYALGSTTSGYENTGVGANALRINTEGNSNLGIGINALYSNITGDNNVAIGNQAGYINTTGNNNTFIGNGTNASSAALTNATAIGANAVVTTSNSLILGSSANVGIGTSSPLQTLDVSGSVGAAIILTSANLTLNATHHTVIVTGAHTITLPAANTCARRIYVIVNRSGASRTVSAYSALTGFTSGTLANATSIMIQSDGTTWYQIK